jgi:curved DNA-binding protein CbpA
MESHDYYEILQVSPNSEPEIIQAAYKRLAFKYHPDRNNDPASQTRMRLINDAYEILSKAEKRHQYDCARKSYLNEKERQRQRSSEQPCQPGDANPVRQASVHTNTTNEVATPHSPGLWQRYWYWVIGVMFCGAVISRVFNAAFKTPPPSQVPTNLTFPFPGKYNNGPRVDYPGEALIVSQEAQRRISEAAEQWCRQRHFDRNRLLIRYFTDQMCVDGALGVSLEYYDDNGTKLMYPIFIPKELWRLKG